MWSASSLGRDHWWLHSNGCSSGFCVCVPMFVFANVEQVIAQARGDVSAAHPQPELLADGVDAYIAC